MRYLVAQVDVGLFGDEEGRHVGDALLRGEVQGCDALEGLRVSVSAVLQQAASHLQLVLLSCYMQRRVAILQRGGTQGQVRGETVCMCV